MARLASVHFHQAIILENETTFTGCWLTRPQSSLSLLLILTREARPGGARGVMGRRKEGSLSFAFLLPIIPSAPLRRASERRLGTSQVCWHENERSEI